MHKILVTSDVLGFSAAAGIAAEVFGRGQSFFRVTLPGSVSDALQNPNTREELAHRIEFLCAMRHIRHMVIVCNGDLDAVANAMTPLLPRMKVQGLKRSLPTRDCTAMIVTCADYRLHLPDGLAAHYDDDNVLIHAIPGFPRIRPPGTMDWPGLQELIRRTMSKGIREIHLIGHTDCGGYQRDDCALLRPDLNMAIGVVAEVFSGTIHASIAHVSPLGVSRLEHVDRHYGHPPRHAHEGIDAPAS